MKIEVLVTLKGNIGEMFYNGDVFVSPDIPETLMEELAANRGYVREIPEAEAPIELLPPVELVEEVIVPQATKRKKSSRIPR
jgi:hypothetical protein